MRRVLLPLLGMLALARTVSAVPIWGERMDLAQPDGSLVPVLIWGDEFYQKVESLDSLALARDAQGWIRYAALAPDSSAWLPSGPVYTGAMSAAGAARAMQSERNLDLSESARSELARANWEAIHPANSWASAPAAAARSLGASSSNRSVVGLAILVDFSDVPATISQSSLDNLFNQLGYQSYGNNGSVRDFYRDISNGHLDYTNVVVAYVRLSRPKSYYDNPTVAFGPRALELVNEALAAVANRGFDFTRISTDGQKNAIALNILYAGTPTAGWARGIWPHMGWTPGYTYGGVKFNVYELTNIGSAPAIGTLCHENGHMVMGWPDLYDYSGSTQGTGAYDLMSTAQPNNPPPPNAWLRDQAGWDSTTRLETQPTGQILRLPANSNRNLRYDNPLNPKEHFYVEARRMKGRSALLPDEGLVVWHIDENGDNANWRTATVKHYKVSLEQADARQDLERGRATGAGDLFHAGYADAFGPATAPNSNWWSGAASAFRLTSIGPVSDTMSLVWSGGASLPLWPAVKLSRTKAGLNLLYQEVASPVLPTFQAGGATKRGTATGIAATVAGGRATNYALSYDGFFFAPVAGIYTFGLGSDGPAKLWLDTALRVDLPAGGDASFTVNLAQGAHVFRTDYVHGTATARLALTVSGGNLNKGVVPATVWGNDATGLYANEPAPVSWTSRGLRSAYYEGTWTALPNFAALTPIRTGLASSLSATGAGATRTKDWGVVYKGWIKVDKLGSYVFLLTSGDGSRLTLDGAVAVENGGSHAVKGVSAAVRLWPGYHSIRLEYYQHAYATGLDLKMSSLGGAYAALPLSLLYNDSAAGLAPQSAPEDEGPGLSSTMTENTMSLRLQGRDLDAVVPVGYQGPVQVDLIDLRGRTVASRSGFAYGEGPAVRLVAPTGERLLAVRMRLLDRIFVQVAPLPR